MDKAYWDTMRWDNFRWDVFDPKQDEILDSMKRAIISSFFVFLLYLSMCTRIALIPYNRKMFHKPYQHLYAYNAGDSEKMKKKAMATVIASLFLTAILAVTPAIADEPSISDVAREKGVCWFHLMTGQYPNGVWVGEWTPEGPRYYEEKGYLALTYRNLRLGWEWETIKLTTSPGADHAFWHWPEKTAVDLTDHLEEVDGGKSFIWDIPPDEVLLMTDLWFIGWDIGQQIEVKLELFDSTAQWRVLYQGTMTIMPLGP